MFVFVDTTVPQLSWQMFKKVRIKIIICSDLHVSKQMGFAVARKQKL